ncbi:hypothetical protein MHH70_07890 [Metasolibacillus sp. FSL H7-0170]
MSMILKLQEQEIESNLLELNSWSTISNHHCGGGGGGGGHFETT